MKKKYLRGRLALTLVVMGSGAALLAGCNADDECAGSVYRCTGQLLERCQDGHYARVEDCTGKGMCMASMGHCHPGGAGGGHAGGAAGAGGQSAGGNGGGQSVGGGGGGA